MAPLDSHHKHQICHRRQFPPNPGASSFIRPVEIRPDGFLATFLETWPEKLVTDATSRWIWNMFCQSHSDADAVYSTLNYRLTTTLESLSGCLTSLTKMLLALEKLSRVTESLVSLLATITTCHNSVLNAIATCLTNHDTTLTTIKTRLENQSNILRKITQQNVSRDARVQTVEGDITLVHGSVNTFNAKLLGLRTTTDMSTSTLWAKVNDLRACIIPNLRCDLQMDIQHSANAMAQVIDNLRRDLQMGIQQSANAMAQVIDDAMAGLTDNRRDLPIRPPPADMTAVPVNAHPPPAATTDANVDDGRAASHACGVSIWLVIVVSPRPPVVSMQVPSMRPTMVPLTVRVLASITFGPHLATIMTHGSEIMHNLSPLVVT